MRYPQLIVFDLAGTTVQDNGEVPESFSAALAQHGVQVTPEQLRKVRGSSKKQAVLDLLPDAPEKIEQGKLVYESFCEQLAARYQTSGVKSIAGSESVFARLRQQGVRVVLNTGFDRQITHLLLTALGWNESTVDGVVCGDAVERGRPAPDLIHEAMKRAGVDDPLDVANVGDTSLDLLAGRNAQVRWNIGVLSGAHDRQELEQAPHTHLIGSVAELLEIWS
jgi:phosphonatase-like hydrolase